MARLVNRAEAWERAHEIFNQVNFNAFDFNTIKESLLDYVKLYYPEDFNDYIESSEFIAILELFAYIGELLAYRLDLNAHENFLTTAQRKESILRLAKMVSYKASRNIPARGLVKMTSISTTENIIDSAGRNLVGRRIYWNDANNPDWKEQFILILNRALEQEYGTVTPDERVQVDDVLFELYTLDNNPFGTGNSARLSYSASAGGTTAPMEIAPIELTADGPQERRPEQNAKFSLVYSNDGLGDGSDTTGFLMFTKQGTLQQQVQIFDGVTPNLTHDIPISDINETDLWLNNIDSFGTILTNNPYAEIMPHLVSEDLRYGEWIEVDLANAQNIIFNTNKNRHKYEVETLDDDQVRVIFGDGEFSDIPSGTFQFWYRTSLNDDYIIEKTAVIDQPGSISYSDVNGTVQTLSFTFSLVSSLLNASASEDIEHIRRTAPSVYYTQDRMVNGRDYNTFMLQDPTILKLRAINRTFAGDSKYIAWHDPRDAYEDLKIFGDDLALYWEDSTPTKGYIQIVPQTTDVGEIIENYLEPRLSGTDYFSIIAPRREALGYTAGGYRTYFSQATFSIGNGNVDTDPVTQKTTEIDSISYALDNMSSPLYLWYSTRYDTWLVSTSDSVDPFLSVLDNVGQPIDDADPFVFFEVSKEPNENWNVNSSTRRMVAQSSTTRFWNTNTADRVVNYDTLNSLTDRLVVLKANIGYTDQQMRVLDSNINYAVIGQETEDTNTSNLPDIQRLSVLPEDNNGDGIPDDILKPSLFNLKISGVWSDLRTVDGTDEYIDLTTYGRYINNSSTKGLDNDVIVRVAGSSKTYANGGLVIDTNIIMNKLRINPFPAASESIEVEFVDHVYFTRLDALSPWEPVEPTDTIRTAFISEDDDLDDSDKRYRRLDGRYPLNFAWMHKATQFNLIDPAVTNIVDIYIITKGYYTALTRWLENRTTVQPSQPTPLDLRTSYADLMDNKMISDTVVLHPGRFKLMFGTRAIPQLQATFKVVRPQVSTLTDNQVKVRIVSIIRQFFDIETWEFGETFFFTELAASIHSDLGAEIDSVVLVPVYTQNQFGDMFQVACKEDELFMPDISTQEIEIVESYTSSNIRQNG